MATQQRVFLASPHPTIGIRLEGILAKEGDLVLCGEEQRDSKALRVLGELEPDIAVIDISIGYGIISDIRRRVDGLPLLVLSEADEAVYAGRCLRAGANGYIMADQPDEEIVRAIRKVLDGDVYLSEKETEKVTKEELWRIRGLVSSDDPIEQLSQRQFEVYELIASGFETAAIAKTLHISPTTVQSHYDNIREILGLRCIDQLQKYAMVWKYGEQA